MDYIRVYILNWRKKEEEVKEVLLQQHKTSEYLNAYYPKIKLSVKLLKKKKKNFDILEKWKNKNFFNNVCFYKAYSTN